MITSNSIPVHKSVVFDFLDHKMFIFKSILPIITVSDLINNGDFENGEQEWNTQGRLDIISGPESPVGLNYAVISERIESWHGLYQDIELSPNDANKVLTASFHTKVNPSQVDVNVWDPWKAKSLTGKLKLRMRENGQNKVVYVSCIASCIGKYQYSECYYG